MVLADPLLILEATIRSYLQSIIRTIFYFAYGFSIKTAVCFCFFNGVLCFLHQKRNQYRQCKWHYSLYSWQQRKKPGFMEKRGNADPLANRGFGQPGTGSQQYPLYWRYQRSIHERPREPRGTRWRKCLLGKWCSKQNIGLFKPRPGLLCLFR